jgi:hypothetical protein
MLLMDAVREKVALLSPVVIYIYIYIQQPNSCFFFLSFFFFFFFFSEDAFRSVNSSYFTVQILPV